VFSRPCFKVMKFSRDGDTPLITGQGPEAAETSDLLVALQEAERRESAEKTKLEGEEEEEEEERSATPVQEGEILIFLLQICFVLAS
jgi:hypothetical protein